MRNLTALKDLHDDIMAFYHYERQLPGPNCAGPLTHSLSIETTLRFFQSFEALSKATTNKIDGFSAEFQELYRQTCRLESCCQCYDNGDLCGDTVAVMAFRETLEVVAEDFNIDLVSSEDAAVPELEQQPTKRTLLSSCKHLLRKIAGRSASSKKN